MQVTVTAQDFEKAQSIREKSQDRIATTPAKCAIARTLKAYAVEESGDGLYVSYLNGDCQLIRHDLVDDAYWTAISLRPQVGDTFNLNI